MKILYIANCGFGDVSWTTSWPRIWSEKGHEVDVFLMRHTGNPFHANPYVKNMFIENKYEAVNKIISVINAHTYDVVLIPDNYCSGVQEVIKVTKNFKNVFPFKGHSKYRVSVSGLDIPPLTKPEWYFTEKESKYIRDQKLENYILFHPLSSSIYEKTRNINFDLIIECSKKLENILVVYGGVKYLPVETLNKMETFGIRLLWEDYNCFNDESGTALGKFLALTFMCQASIHAWSGSFTFPMGLNKPYVMVVPGYELRANKNSTFIKTVDSFKHGMQRAKNHGCLNPSIWCITEQVDIIISAVNYAIEGKTGIYDNTWKWY